MVAIYFVMAYCTFYGNSKLCRYAHGDVMSLININKYKMVEQ